MPCVSIDIVIVNYRCTADTLQALAPLAQWPHGTVWVVDNSASALDITIETDQLKAACTLMPAVKLLIPANNLGFGSACNLAFEPSSAEFFLLLNPDARIDTLDVLTLRETLIANPRWGGVSPKIYWNAQRSFVQPTAFAQTPWRHLAQALATRSRTIAQWAAYRGVRKSMQKMTRPKEFSVDFLAGSVLMLRRTAVLRVGGLFDPQYFMFYEDSDLSLRLRNAGYGMGIAPQACAEHTYRHKPLKASLMAQSEQQYFNKFFGWFYRLSGKLQHIPRFGRPVVLTEWFQVLPQPIVHVEDFTLLTGAADVLAFSPTLLMMPSIFRLGLQSARTFDTSEWELLEPGNYTALLMKKVHGNSVPLWVYFSKA